MSAKGAVEAVFSKPVADTLWTGSTLHVYPATPQNFSVGSVLPAVFYMMRRGHRRGKGSFQEHYCLQDGEKATIFQVAYKLSLERDRFEGFDSEVSRQILGDLLLCDALENKKHAEGQHLEVQRAFPVHFFSSWLDLPGFVAHLRFVPEMLVALLARQDQGLDLMPSPQGPFSVGKAPESNLLFKIFGKGVRFGENTGDLSCDCADEDAAYSVEEWLMVQLGTGCKQAPEQLRRTQRGRPEIQNFKPLAAKASKIFSGDLVGFLTSFGETIPRRALTPMMECLIGLGIWHTFLSSLKAATVWELTGKVPTDEEQHSLGILVDASSGSDPLLREISEHSMSEALRFLDEAAVAMAVVRIMDAACRHSPMLNKALPPATSIENWLNLLGLVRAGGHPASQLVAYGLGEKVSQLVNQLRVGTDAGAALAILEGNLAETDPARALAEALCALIPDKQLGGQYRQFMDCAAMINEPHGLLSSRKVQRTLSSGKKKRFELRSVQLSNTLLETLVHISFAARGARLSFRDFLGILHERYGLWVDEAPPGVNAARAQLLRNRNILERRLRDLGLPVGVNDAESMKRLRPRYRTAVETPNPVA